MGFVSVASNMEIPSKYEHKQNNWYECECGAVVYIGEDFTEDFRWHERRCVIESSEQSD